MHFTASRRATPRFAKPATLGRARSAIVDTVKRVAVFGVVAWETPWERIEQALRRADARVEHKAPPPCLVDRFAWAQVTSPDR